MKKLLGYLFLWVKGCIPSARLRLLLGSWILTTGMMSCVSKQNGSDKDKDSTKVDSSLRTCYAAAIDPAKKNNVTTADSSAVDSSEKGQIMCYSVPRKIDPEKE